MSGAPRGGRPRAGCGRAALLPLLLLALACDEAPPPPEPAAPPAESPRARPARPATNVVIFLVDTLRADRLGAYGHPRPTSPALDRLAAEGVVFERAHAPAPWTMPSVVSILTSTFPCEHQVVIDGRKLASELVPLAERFSRLGYATASIYANAYAGPPVGLDRGFDLMRYQSPFEPRVVARWLDSRSGERPFFLYLHTVQPHDPYRPPESLVELFGEVTRRRGHEVNQAMRGYRRLTHADRVAGLPLGTIDNRAEQAEANRQLTSLAPDIETLYDAEVRRADESLAEVIELLQRRGHWRNTLFVFTSDHGEELGDHGAWQHNHRVYEEVVHVPLVMRFPGAAFAGRRVSAPVTLVDLVPTLFDHLGVPEAATPTRGRSLMPLVRGEPEPEGGVRFTAVRINQKVHHALLFEREGNVNVAFVDGRYKGIWNVDRDTLELYDLETDAGEQVDLVAAGRAPERAAALRDEAGAWFQACIERAVETRPGGLEDVDPEMLEGLRELGYVE